MDGLIWLVLFSVAGYWVVRLMRDYWQRRSASASEGRQPDSLLDVLKGLPAYVQNRRGSASTQPQPDAQATPVAPQPGAALPGPSDQAVGTVSAPASAASTSATVEEPQASLSLEGSASDSLVNPPQDSQPAAMPEAQAASPRPTETMPVSSGGLAPSTSHVQLSFDLTPGARVRVTVEALPDTAVNVIGQAPLQSTVSQSSKPAAPIIPSAVAAPAIRKPSAVSHWRSRGAHLAGSVKAFWQETAAGLRQEWSERRSQLAALAASPVLAFIAGRAAGDGEKALNPAVAIVGWVGAITLVVYGGWRGLPRAWRLSRPTVIWVVGLTLVALAARAWDTTHIPVVLTGDEGSAGLSAMRFVTGAANNLFSIGWYSFPSLYFFIQSLSIRLLGPTIAALRLPSAMAGALTVAGLYLLGRVMFGHKTGLAAAILLAGLHFHLHFSRIGLNNIWDGLSYVIVLGALWHGWQAEERGSFLLAGVTLGLAQYFYPSSRSLFILVLVWVMMAGLMDLPRLRRNLPSLALMALVAGVVLLPLALFFIRHPDEYMAPISRVTILGPWLKNEVTHTGLPAWRILFEQFKLGFGAYVQVPVRMWYLPGVPILRTIPAFFFLVGSALLLWRFRDPRTLMLGLWLIISAAAGALSESAPAAQRYVAAAPGVVLIAAYGLTQGVEFLSGLWPRYASLAGLAVVALAAGLAVGDARFYFSDYTPKSAVDASLGGDNTLVANRLALYLQEKSSDWQALFFGAPRMGYYSIPSLQYLAPHITGYDVARPWGSPENPQPTSSRLMFVFLPGFDGDRGIVEASYPGGKWIQENMPDGRVLYWLYEYDGTMVPPPVPLPTPTSPPPPTPLPTQTLASYPATQTP